MAGDDPGRASLLCRGQALEYATLSWNVAGLVVLAIAALSAGYHPRHSGPGSPGRRGPP